jgi:hypothetical protein
MQEYSSFEIDAQGTRFSVRFPLRLPVVILSDGREYSGTTENISSNGVLFRLNENLPVDANIEFLLVISAGEIFEESAAVHCLGRVVRSYKDRSEHYAAAVIDEYRFQ